MDVPSAICNYGSSSSSGGSIDSETRRHRPRTRVASPMCDAGMIDRVPSNTSNQTDDVALLGTGGGYEEFFGGTMVCPTCNGKGRISRGQLMLWDISNVGSLSTLLM